MKIRVVRATSIFLIVIGIISIALSIHVISQFFYSVVSVTQQLPIRILSRGLLNYLKGAKYHNDLFSSIGLSAGVSYIVTGAIGLEASWKNTKPSLTAVIVVCCLSMPIAFVQFLFAVIHETEDAHLYDLGCDDTDDSRSYCIIPTLQFTLMTIAIVAMITIFVLLVFVAKAIGCSACGKPCTTAIPSICRPIASASP